MCGSMIFFNLHPTSAISLKTRSRYICTRNIHKIHARPIFSALFILLVRFIDDFRQCALRYLGQWMTSFRPIYIRMYIVYIGIGKSLFSRLRTFVSSLVKIAFTVYAFAPMLYIAKATLTMRPIYMYMMWCIGRCWCWLCCLVLAMLFSLSFTIVVVVIFVGAFMHSH